MVIPSSLRRTKIAVVGAAAAGARAGCGAAGDKPVVETAVEMGGTASGCPEGRKRRRGETTVVDEEPDPGDHHQQMGFEKEARRYAFLESLRVQHECKVYI